MAQTKIRYDQDDTTGVENHTNIWLQKLPWQWLAGLMILVGALALNFYRLSVPSVWFDEAFSVELSRLPFPLLWHTIFGPEPSMELYYLMLHFWLRITGVMGIMPTEAVVRLPSVVFATGSAILVYMAGRRYAGLIAGLAAGLLYILNPLQLLYAQQTRAYALELFLICLAWYALWNAISGEKRNKIWWGIHTLAWVLAIYSHFFSFLMVATEFIAVAGLFIFPNEWRSRVRRQAIASVCSFVAIAMLVFPMLQLATHGGRTGWMPIPHPRDIYHLFMTMVGDKQYYLFLLVVLIGIGVLIVGISYVISLGSGLQKKLPGKAQVLSPWFAQSQYVPLIWCLLCWLVIPIAISYVVSQGSTRLFSSRYLVVVIPPLCLLAGFAIRIIFAGKKKTRNVILQIAVMVILVAAAAKATPVYYRSAQVEDWNSAAPWLMARYQSGDGLICYNNDQGCQISLEYYLHAYPESGAQFTPDSPGAHSWERYGFATPGQNAQSALDRKLVAAYLTKHPRLFFVEARLDGGTLQKVKEMEKWLDAHYHYVDQIVTTTVTIRLYQSN